MDSSGLGTLVGLHTSARSVGGEIKLAGLTGRVKDVLQITKLGSIFEFYDTPEEAAPPSTCRPGRTVAAEWARRTTAIRRDPWSKIGSGAASCHPWTHCQRRICLSPTGRSWNASATACVCCWT